MQRGAATHETRLKPREASVMFGPEGQSFREGGLNQGGTVSTPWEVPMIS
jgi:hypothetical protein